MLIIGSLIWNKSQHRLAWRDDRLAVANAERVRSPIRYGRLSLGNTYTMVFSNSLLPNHCGWALAVPCSRAVEHLPDLIGEAQALWAADQPQASAPGPLAASWGAVGLLSHPDRQVQLADLQAGWANRIESEHEIYKAFPHGAGESPAVAPNGLLTIPWPTTATGELYDSDVLLATATVPRPLTAGTYATPQAVANGWKAAPDRKNYFDESRSAGITTAFDDDILKCLEEIG